jgi:hypothetical protein
MKTLAAALIAVLVVYSLATAWTDLVQPRIEELAQTAASKSRDDSVKSRKKKASRRQVPIDDVEDDEDLEPDDEPPPKVAVKSTRLRKRSREEPVISEIAKDRVLAQLADVKSHESRLLAREETLRMLYEDIRSELAAVEDLRRRSANELAIAERRVLEAAVSRPSIASSNDTANEPLSSARPRSVAESRIASVIHDLASQGNVAAAASLLSGMKDREVAKVLTSLSARDPRMALRISDQVQAAKQDPVRR